nr:transposase [Candidatus Collinsella stercoripullorum]
MPDPIVTLNEESLKTDLRGVRMFTGDKAAGMVGSATEVFPEAACLRREARFYRNVLAKVPKS